MINQNNLRPDSLILKFALNGLPGDRDEFERSLRCYENLKVSYDVKNLLTSIAVEVDVPQIILKLYRQNDKEAREFIHTIKFNFKERCKFAMHKVNSTGSL